MEVKLLPQADIDLACWIITGNKSILKKIAQITSAIIENPYPGIGKPEALKYDLATAVYGNKGPGRKKTPPFERRFFICETLNVKDYSHVVKFHPCLPAKAGLPFDVSRLT